MTTNTDAVPECYPLGIIQEAITSRIPREFSGWREWPGTRVLAQAVIEALKVRETVLAARAQSPVAGVQAEAVRVTEADVIQTCEVHGLPLDPEQMEVVTAVVNQILLSASKPVAPQEGAEKADARDKARYRFLRDGAIFSLSKGESPMLEFAKFSNVEHDFHTGYIGPNFDADVDRAIDRAMAAAVSDAGEDGPEFEDGPDEEGFQGARPWNGFNGTRQSEQAHSDALAGDISPRTE